MDTKWCRRCDRTKLRSEFPPNERCRDGLHTYCRECSAAASRASYYKRRGTAQPSTVEPRRRATSPAPEGAKWCPDCQELKPLGDFPRNRNTSNGRAPYCKPCHNLRGRASRDKVGGSRTYHLKRRYGLTAEEVDAMVEAQGGKCAACRIDEPKHVDHDHATGEVRGILCFRCNVALGNVGDELARLQGLAAYLLRAEGRIVSVLQMECPRPAPTGARALLRDETPRWTLASPAG